MGNPFSDLADNLADGIRDVGDDIADFGKDLVDDLGDLSGKILDPVFEGIGSIGDLLGIDFGALGDVKVGNLKNGKVIRRGNTASIPVVYGSVPRLAGTFVFSGYLDGTLDLVYVFCEGEVAAINTVYLRQGDEYVPVDDARFDGKVTVTKFTGTASQASASDITTRHAEWTSNHRLLGVAYIHIKVTHPVPEPLRGSSLAIFADIDGRKVYDPRTTLTAHTHNPALIVRDYLTHAIYGKGIDSADLSEQDFIDAANYCDTLVTPYTGAAYTQAIYTCDGVLDTGARVFDNLKALLSCCNGFVVFTGGKWRLLIERDASAVFTFNRDNIIGAFQVSAAGRRSVFNRVTAKFNSAQLDSKTDEVALDDATLRSTQDAGIVLEENLTLPFTTDYYRALDLCEITKNRSRLRLACSFTATCAALQVNVGSVVNVTHPTLGWTNKLFRLVSRTLRADGNVSVALVEYSSGVYTLGAKSEFTPPAATSLPDAFIVLAPTIGTPLSGNAQLILGTSGDVVSRIYLPWTAPNDLYRAGFETQYKRGVDSLWLPANTPLDPSLTATYIAPVVDGTAYDLRVRAINSSGRASAWSTLTNYVVIGKTEAPPPLLAFSLTRQADGTRQYEWTYGDEPFDLEGARIYWKADSGGTPPALNTMTVLKTAELINRKVRTLENNQLPADTYWFAGVTVDTTGNESTPLYIQADLDEPRVENAILQVNEQPAWSGTKTDCFVQDGKLIANAAYTWASLTTWTAWTAWNVPSVSPISYSTASIDIGAIIQFAPVISASVLGTKTLEIRWSNDNSTWSAWTAYAAQSVSARYLQVRISVSGSTPEISALSILITAPVVDEYFNDIDCSSSSRVTVTSTGVITLNLVKTYATILYVNPVIQSIAASDEWKATVTGKATSGPVVTFYKKIAGTWTLTTPTSSTPVDFYVRGA